MTRILGLAFAMGITLGAIGNVWASADDDTPAPIANPVEEAGDEQFSESNFDEWVFGGVGNADAARKRIDSQLKLRLDELNRFGGLDETQQRKLLLAGKGDVTRYFDQVDAARQKFLLTRTNPNVVGQILEDIRPLQFTQATEFFSDKSYFVKTVRTTLTPDQAAARQKAADARRLFRYRASVEYSVTCLERIVVLRQDQHEALIALLVEQTSPPNLFGQGDYAFVMQSLARLPNENVRPIFDEHQWGLMELQLKKSLP